MKKISILILTLALFLAALPVFASAFGQGIANVGTLAGIATTVTLSQYAAGIITTLLGLVGVIFVALLIYGGFLYMTSGGETEKTKKSRSVLVASVIGLLIVVSGYSIAFFVAQTLESPGTTPPSFNAACEDPGALNYYSCSCCAYRRAGEPKCCSQSCCIGTQCGNCSP